MLSTSRSSTDDPLARAFVPSPNESQHDKENRIRAEQEAKKRSDAIDEEINKQRNARKNSKPVKILLLGESLPVRFPPLCLADHIIVRQVKVNQVRCVPSTTLHSWLNPHVFPRYREVDNVEEWVFTCLPPRIPLNHFTPALLDFQLMSTPKVLNFSRVRFFKSNFTAPCSPGFPCRAPVVEGCDSAERCPLHAVDC